MPKTNSVTRKLPTSIPPKGQTTVQTVGISLQPQPGVKSYAIQLKEPIGVASTFQPRGNRVLIRRLEENTNFVLTDAPKSIKGIVLATGPGKWHPGEWWSISVRAKFPYDFNDSRFALREWRWIDGWREPMSVRVGQLVLFNSKWNDLAHAENTGTGADGKGPLERPLSYKLDPLTHLVTEDDIFCILSENVQASYVGTAVEAQYFRNTTTAEECFTTRVRPR